MADSVDLPNPPNLAFVEALYERYRVDPGGVTPEWNAYFASLDEHAGGNGGRVGPSFIPPPLFGARNGARSVAAAAGGDVAAKVLSLVYAYRRCGHLRAQLDPLARPRPGVEALEPSFHGLEAADLDRSVRVPGVRGGASVVVRELMAELDAVYCGTLGVQLSHIDDEEARAWLHERLEGRRGRRALGHDDEMAVLTALTRATAFEEFLHKKYTGAKSFSLEGCESLIPLLARAIDAGVDGGAREVVLAMAHRGRLNVLANIIGKRPSQIFHEFDDRDAASLIGRGDVKYHLGHSATWKSRGGREAHLTLCFNPSHLELVGAVALGRVRAKQDRDGDGERRRTFAIIMHGDAAFAGEGVVQETLNLSQLDAYRTGGTLHVIVNNQIGFTTSPEQGRSCTYATDVARLLQIPIVHVNGEDLHAVAAAVDLAMDFRARFRRDVVIDLYGYRRWGHNEGDEPAFTQPQLYEVIRARPGVRAGQLARMARAGTVTAAEADAILETCRGELEEELDRARSKGSDAKPFSTGEGVWKGYVGGPEADAPELETGVERRRLAALLTHLAEVPDDFRPHPTITRLLGQRAEMAAGERPLDWGAAELLAYATLAVEGAGVRLTGQDAERGTFSHRHAVLHDREDGRRYVALENLGDSAARVEVANSPLSEVGVLGFEYGYSLDTPERLVIWEAQFGDFANCAQAIIDQFISSAEDKWRRLCGLVMLLPHGFEGMGPEHSSARLERYLDLCAEDNIRVVIPTTPAQHFHVLRRQVVSPYRKPLVVFSPKSLLRHKAATSTLDELSAGRFARVLGDTRPPERAGQTTRILLCSGKVYYDLEAERERTHRYDVAILRIEQLYPFPYRELSQALVELAADTPVCWVQEEPENMGAWRYLRNLFVARLVDRHPLFALCRPESASPATGSRGAHDAEQLWLLHRAFEMPLLDPLRRQLQDESEIAQSLGRAEAEAET